MGSKPISQRMLADVAEWLSTCENSESIGRGAKRVPLGGLFACRHQGLLAVTERHLQIAARQATQPRRLEPTDQFHSAGLLEPAGCATAVQRALDALQLADGSSYTELETTCLHEAAHASVAIALGVPVLEASVRPTPGADGMPGSLGHVLHTRLPDPLPLDAWASSLWVETSVMVGLAGYTLEAMIDPNYEPSPLEETDYVHAMATLRCVEPDPASAQTHFQRLRRKTMVLVSQEWLLADITKIARDLHKAKRITGRELYTDTFGGTCSAVYPGDPAIRCDIPNAHPRGDHTFMRRGEEPIHWKGFPYRPPRKVAIGSLAGPIKSLRILNDGGRAVLPKKWELILEEAMGEPVEITDEPFPTAWCG